MKQYYGKFNYDIADQYVQCTDNTINKIIALFMNRKKADHRTQYGVKLSQVCFNSHNIPLKGKGDRNILTTFARPTKIVQSIKNTRNE